VQQVGYGPYLAGVGGEWDWKVLFLIEVSTNIPCLVKGRAAIEMLICSYESGRVLRCSTFWDLIVSHFWPMFRVSLAYEIGALIPFTPPNVAVLASLALYFSPKRQACEWYYWCFSGML
jgi:hypothetical protein